MNEPTNCGIALLVRTIFQYRSSTNAGCGHVAPASTSIARVTTAIKHRRQLKEHHGWVRCAHSPQNSNGAARCPCRGRGRAGSCRAPVSNSAITLPAEELLKQIVLPFRSPSHWSWMEGRRIQTIAFPGPRSSILMLATRTAGTALPEADWRWLQRSS